MSSAQQLPKPDLDPATGLAEALRAPVAGMVALAELLARQPLSPAARAQTSALLLNARRISALLDDVRPAPAARRREVVSLRDLVETLDAGWRMRSACPVRVLLSHALPVDLEVSSDREALSALFEEFVAAGRRRASGDAVEVELAAAPDEGGRVRIAARILPLTRTAPGETFARRRLYELAEAFGAALRETRNPGEGARLELDLHLDAPGEEAWAEAEAPLPPGAHVLIVDDNATNRMVAAALCASFGCTTETAEDGVEAVAAVRARPFDAVLMDIKMPRMDGVAATRAIQQMKGRPGRTPIIAITANAGPEDAARYLAIGMAGVVDKPIKPGQLLLALQEALGLVEHEAPHRDVAAPAA